VYSQGTIVTEEDFSWEDDDDESVAAESKSLSVPRPSSQRTLAAKKAADADDVHSPPTLQFHTPMTMSPRSEGEDSYDVVSGNVSTAGDVQELNKEEEEGEEEESDWE
jgi:hypothetical protein